MDLRRFLIVALAVGFLGFCGPRLAGADDAATQPSPVIAADARQLLDQVRDAYAALKSLSISGTVSGHFDIDGQKHDDTAQFTGLFDSGKFRHEMIGDVIAGGTGDSVYMYVPAANKYLLRQTMGRVYLDTLDSDIADLIRKQDLSLALALARDAGAEIVNGSSAVAKDKPTNIDGVDYPTLRLSQDTQDMSIVVDPKTNLLRQMTVDLTKLAKSRGAHEIKSANLTVDFSQKTDVNPDPNLFAWTPPAGAQVVAQSPLEGKSVPSFSVAGLDGTQISSDGLKGTVYVLDFWATWCGPCVASLPHLDQFYQQMKGAGVTIIAVNEGDPKETVQKFVQDQKLTLPVALDMDGKMGETFGTDILPTTLVIGRDGIIRKAFQGVNMHSEDDIRRAVQAAVDAK